MNRLSFTKFGISLLGLMLCFTLATAQADCNIPSQLDFTQQSQIDAFATNYPNCSNVKSLRISGDQINNLRGLSQIRNIESLLISNTSSLTNLAGLENIEAISRNCHIQNTSNLPSLQGLHNVKYIRNVFVANNLGLQTVDLSKLETTDNLNILQNRGLTALGLTNLRQAQVLSINNNRGLSTLESLANVESIHNFRIKNNPDLVSLDGISKLESLEFGLEIIGNPILSDISALGDFRFKVDAPFFKIYNNPSLSDCAITAFCEDVMNNASSQNSEVRNNATGCNNKSEISISCGGQAVCENLPDELRFTSQAQIDAFPSNYPNCTQIKNITLFGHNINNLRALAQITKADTFGIFNTSIRNLNGLENLREVTGRFRIDDNRLLENLTALEAFSNVGDMTINTNGELVNLQGLENITRIQDLFISANPKLQSLAGLDNLRQVQTRIVLQNHPLLTDISALEQVHFTTSRARFSITSNNNLSHCAIASVCELVALGNQAAVLINNNASGCTSKEEVQTACSSGNCDEIPEVLRFNNQAQIDNFGANYPNCTIAGDIFITGNDITNLQGLSKLTEVKSLWIYETAVLSSLQGLHNIQTAKSIQIRENAALSVLILQIERADVLNIYENPILERIVLSSLQRLRYTMSIQSNPRLATIGDIALEFTENLKIKFNPVLTSLDGFNKLQTLEFGLEIIGNPVLTDISALEGMRFNAEQPYFKVYNNASLSECAITSFCEDIQDNPNSQNSEIRNNAMGCNDKAEVRTNCTEGNSADLEILNTTCPIQYPKANGNLTFDVTVRNNSTAATPPSPLSLYRKHSGRRGDILTRKYGEATIPNIPAGEVRTFTLTYPIPFEQLLVPNTVIAVENIVLGDALTFASDNGVLSAENSYDIDLYCQKDEVDIALELFADDFTYGEDGIISYTLRISNRSGAKAHNLNLIYAYANNEIGQVVSLDIPDGTSIFGGTAANAIPIPQYWIIPELEANESREINVTYNVGGYLGIQEEFPLATGVVGPHLEDTNYANNSVNALFTRAEGIMDGIDLELSLSTDTPDIGQWKSGTFTFTLENKGNVDATHVNVRLDLDSEEGVVVGGTTAVVSNGIFSHRSWTDINLAAGGSATLELQLFSRVPNLNFFAEVVYANEMDIDSTPNNQEETEDDFVRFTASTPLPDLVLQISSLQFPLQFPINEVSRFMLDIGNAGSASANAEFLVSFILSSDEVLSEEDVQVGEILTGYLNTRTYPTTAAVRIPDNITPGNYTIFAIVDALDSISELNEDNNTLQIPVSIISGGNLPNLNIPQQAIQIAPNPASDMLYIQGKYEADTPYQIFDMYGKLWKAGYLGSGSITISELANGTYYLKLANRENTLLRFVKIR